ncbi:MAG: DinB family protein [Nocardioides sp.]|nr:DinB family protein [Nocardioides sp.]
MTHWPVAEHKWWGGGRRATPAAARGRGVDWDGDPDWEFRTAADDSPEVLLGLFDEAVEASDRILDEIGDDLDREAEKKSHREGMPFDLRWILVHMIEEYARHNGHADLIRETVDGTTGE